MLGRAVGRDAGAWFGSLRNERPSGTQALSWRCETQGASDFPDCLELFLLSRGLGWYLVISLLPGPLSYPKPMGMPTVDHTTIAQGLKVAPVASHGECKQFYHIPLSSPLVYDTTVFCLDHHPLRGQMLWLTDFGDFCSFSFSWSLHVTYS